jgi:hypothetical protein
MSEPGNKRPSAISIDAERLWSRHMEMARSAPWAAPDHAASQ